jgi:hypothetical protein
MDDLEHALLPFTLVADEQCLLPRPTREQAARPARPVAARKVRRSGRDRRDGENMAPLGRVGMTGPIG